MKVDFVKGIYAETLDQLADRWSVVMNQVNRQIGPYPNQLYIEVATLIYETEHVIELDPFEQDVLQTARKLSQDGNLKMALFRLHEVVEARLEGPYS
jgi:hypothetical protein